MRALMVAVAGLFGAALLGGCDGSATAEAPAAQEVVTLNPRMEAYLAGSDPQPRRFLLGRFTYAPGEDALPAEAGPTVTALATALKAHPMDMVRVESYALEGGGGADEHLAAKRAHYFMKALEAAGVEKRRVLGTAGRPLPGSEPIDPEALAAATNGRTDVIFYRDFSKPG